MNRTSSESRAKSKVVKFLSISQNLTRIAESDTLAAARGSGLPIEPLQVKS